MKVTVYIAKKDEIVLGPVEDCRAAAECLLRDKKLDFQSRSNLLSCELLKRAGYEIYGSVSCGQNQVSTSQYLTGEAGWVRDNGF